MPGRFDRWLDRFVATATSLPRFFRNGWGPLDLLDALVDRAAAPPAGPPASIDIRWRPGRRRIDGTHLFRGWFESPDTALPLPPRTRTAHIQLLLPPDAFEGPRPAVCLHLAGTGDVTYAGRRLMAAPLAREHDIGAMILQNPYYGERQPSGQCGVKLGRVVDQLLMNLATLAESRALLRWLYEEGYGPLGVTGYSMGGYMAALTAQRVSSFPLAVVPCASGDSARYPLMESPLRRQIAWRRLRSDFPGESGAYDFLAERLDRLSVSRLGELPEKHEAILVGARQDLFIPPSHVRRLHDHWSRAELRWVGGGHTTGWTLHNRALRRAVADAFDRTRSPAPLSTED